ncbi:MAG: asparagine synthase [Phycisphaerae bacterium SM23_30]|nr:MAG: asparagine synthase [Phycisphaerae bacterium SM23_30]
MCGIAGICLLNNSGEISLEVLRRMTAALHHRGPDEAGIYLDHQVGLGHARLSIIDLSSGCQPIHNEDETLWIIYNGEVYNYVELKQELVEKGYSFYTTSDTEVVLQLYQEEGPDCLERLNGQFAMAIWDAKKQELFLARDRVGIRPLHYTIQNNALIFSSEIKSIFMVESVPREIDPIAMDQIFTFWTTLPGYTIFKNIHELPPGHYLKLSKGQIIVKRYWDFPLYPRYEHWDLSPYELSEQIRQLLLEAVRIRLRADVTVGSYLSGGLDSSGVTSLIVNNFNSEACTFGIRFEEEAFDEGDHQNRMVSFLKVNHREVHAHNKKIGSVFPEVVWHTEKPLLRTAPVPLFLLSRLVRENSLKVVLTGEGADEVFGGYNIFREAKVRRFWAKQPHSDRRSALIDTLYPYIFKNPRLQRSLHSFFSRGLNQIDDPFFSHLIRWENTSNIKKFFSQELQTQIGAYNGYEQLRQSLPAAYDQWDGLSQAQYLEIVLFLSNYLLSSQGDRMAMGNSVEIRLPFLDPNLMEFMGRVPSRWKILGLNEKHILKKSFTPLLPEEIIRRAKHPYRAPIKHSLLNENACAYTKEMLSESMLKKAGLFKADKVNLLIRKMLKVDQSREIDDMALVGILSSQLVYQQFVANFPHQFPRAISLDLVVDRRKTRSSTLIKLKRKN